MFLIGFSDRFYLLIKFIVIFLSVCLVDIVYINYNYEGDLFFLICKVLDKKFKI